METNFSGRRERFWNAGKIIHGIIRSVSRELSNCKFAGEEVFKKFQINFHLFLIECSGISNYFRFLFTVFAGRLLS